MTFTAIAIGAAATLATLSVGSLALPRHVVVERQALLEAAPDAVLALAASNAGFQQFNPYKSTDPDLQISLFGPTDGVGSGFHFDGKDGKGSQTVTSVTNDAVTFAIDLGAMGQPVQSIRAAAVPGGTQVTWRVESDMGLNPVFRVFGLFMDGMMGPTFERGLANLGAAAA